MTYAPIIYSFTTSFTADAEWMNRIQETSRTHQMKVSVTWTKPSPWRHPVRWWRFGKSFGRKTESVTMSLPSSQLQCD